ncbi:MAG: sodium:solute symporter family transporter, partial [Cetobacterium sp.]
NSAATLFCFDIYKPVMNPNVSDEKLIKVAKIVATFLALFSMFVAPLTMYAEGGLFEVMRRFTGFFNIPTIAIVLVGFFSKKVTAFSAKVSVVTHIILYTLLIFVLKVKVNYIHIMGILFMVNTLTMLAISAVKPGKIYEPKKLKPAVDMKPWKRFPEVATLLLGLMVFTYILLSPIGIVSIQKEVGDMVGPNFKYAIIILLAGMSVVYSGFKKAILSIHEKAEIEQEEIAAEEAEELEVSFN